MSDYVTESAETLAGVLAEHQRVEIRGCTCGAVCEADRTRGWHVAHVTAALIASGAVRPAAEVRAEALRDTSERIDRAIQALADIRQGCDYDSPAYKRLTAKIEGVALAGAYLDETLRAALDGAQS